MHKLIPAVFFTLIISTLQAQQLDWVGQIGGSDADQVNELATDASANVFAVAGFYNTADLDPGIGVSNHTSLGGQDMVLLKLDPAGNLLWVNQTGGISTDLAEAIAVDPSGNAFTAGYFYATADFDAHAGITALTSLGGQDAYVAKYDPDGNFLWVAQAGSLAGSEEIAALATDAAGNVYSVGYFQNTVDFDPGPAVHNETAAGSDALFIWKLDPDGNFIWVKQINGTLSEDANDITVDASGKLYLTGQFYGTVDFNPGAGTYNLTAGGFNADAFVVKLASDGSFIWAGQFTGTENELGTDLAVDPDGANVYIGGWFGGSADFNPGAGTYNMSPVGNYDGFLVKLTAAGGFVWALHVGGTGYDYLEGLAVKNDGSVLISGDFEISADMDPGAGTVTYNSAGFTDIYITTLNPDGTYVSSAQIGGTGTDWIHNLVVDPNGGVLAGGFFEFTSDFDPGPGTSDLTSTSLSWDGFIAKYCTSYTIENDVAICSGDSFFADGAFQTTSGDYYDYYTPVEGCDSTVITHLTVNDPHVDLGPDGGICDGSTLLLDAGNPGASYTWSTGAHTQTINVAAAGSFSVVITDGAGCTTSDAISLSAFPAPNVNLGFDQHPCEGTSVLLDAGNPGASYLWSTGQETQTISVTTTGTYQVVVTNGFGCSDSDAVMVTFHAAPVVDLGGDVLFCNNIEYFVNAGNPGCTYLWNSGDTSQSVEVTASGTYSVEVTNVYGCVGSNSITAVLYAASYVDLGADTSICEGESVTLNASTPFCTYQWDVGSFLPILVVYTGGTYSVLITNLAGCEDTDEIVVTVLPVPEVAYNAADDTVCVNDPAFALSGGDPSGGIYSGDGVSGGNFDPASAGIGAHEINYTITGDNGCSATSSIQILVELCDGIQTNDASSSIRLFPNPASDYSTLHLKGLRGDGIMRILTIEGKTISEERVTIGTDESLLIHTSDLASGTYIIQYITNHRVYSCNLVINK